MGAIKQFPAIEPFVGPQCGPTIHIIRGPKDHINIRIPHSGSKDQYKEDTRKHGW